MRCVMLSEYMQAEAREAGFVDAGIALCSERSGEPFGAPVVLMSSGENVVTVGKEKGIGGRNQEYCIAAATRIAGSKSIVIGAVDTDGLHRLKVFDDAFARGVAGDPIPVGSGADFSERIFKIA